MPVAEKHTFRFGPFQLDTQFGQVSKDGIVLKLQGQPVQILEILLAKPGELVTRDELRQRLWASDTFVDFDHSLNTAIKKLRQALNDEADTPRYIQTLPKRGYRFIAPVEGSDVSFAHPSDPTPPSEQTIGQSARWRLISRPALMVAVMAVTSLTAVTTLLWRSSRTTAVPSRVMLAVLPFDNLGSDPSQDYFAEGMTEELITQLGGWNPDRLGVIARTSSGIYKRGDKTVAQVGRELGVNYVVEGSARREGRQVRIAAQLIQVRDQTHLWTKEYDRDQPNVLALESEVAADIAYEIGVKLSPSGNMHSTSIDAEAQEDYLKGQHYWNQLTCQGFEAALPLLEHAVQRDPRFDSAEATLAATYYKLAEFGCRPAKEVLPKAKDAALKTVQLDGQLARGRGYAVLGVIAQEYDWDRPTAERELKLATQLNPNDAIAHGWYAAVSCEAGSRDLCLSELSKARDLDPTALVTNVIRAYLLYCLHRYDEALEGAQKTAELYPDSALPAWVAGLVYEQKGEDTKAADAYLKNVELRRQPDAVTQRYRSAITREGWRGYWTEVVREAPGSGPSCDTATAYAHLRDKDRTLRELERSVQEQCPDIFAVNREPVFDFVRSDPRFRAVLKEIGLQN